VDIHDDLIQYINDSLQWIPTINPSIPESGYGLNIHGITLIDEHGAVLMGNIFNWELKTGIRCGKSLRKQTPRRLNKRY
jgi:hypothetical protein